MSIYIFTCDECEESFEYEMTPKTFKNKRTCPTCKQKTLYQEFGSPYFSIKLVDSELKTVGHLADRNRDRMPSDQKEEIYRKDTQFLRDRYNQPTPEVPGIELAKPKKEIKWTEEGPKKKRRPVKKKKQ